MLLKIISLLYQILTELKGIKAVLEGDYVPRTSIEEELLDNSDATRLLKISGRTLYRWRKEKRISWQVIGNKYYYVKAELIRAKENL